MIDRNRLLQLQQDIGADDLAEVLAAFLEETDEAVAELAPGPQLAARLHFLKGGALNLGLAGFAALCEGAEQATARAAPVDLAGLRADYATARSALVKTIRGLPG